MSEGKGVKELKELLEGVEVVALAAKKITADGKVGLDDAGAIIEAVKQYQVLIDAVKGIGEIPSEVKDLELVELQEIAASVLALAAKLKAA